MKKALATVFSLAAAVLLLMAPAGSFTLENRNDPQTATGVVFHDVNGNRAYDDGEPLLPDVRVSNGREITKTDDAGRYRLPIDDDAILFVVKPRGWRTPLSETHLPRFYYIHKPLGSPKTKYAGVAPTGPLPDSVDFALYPQEEPDEFKALLFGDPQPRNQQEIDFIAHDVIEELVGTDASFGVTLGDILFDDLSLFESQARSIALLEIPWYNVIGNHDINYDATDDRTSDETFERAFGPSYYSFDYGPVHFLVLDDVEWYVEQAGRRGRYRGGLGAEQMAFIKTDLAMIPEDQLVVLMMHIPLVNVEDRQELYRLIEQRPFCISISGHTHHHQHRFITREDGWRGPKPHHHIINVTVSGSWWGGSPDERNIPHTIMADGAPNGYSIISFDGTDYKLDFKAAGRPKDYQMQIHAPESATAGRTADAEVAVNVFNGSQRSTVEMRVGRGGTWTALKQIPMIDPTLRQVYDREKLLGTEAWTKLPEPKLSTHIWTGRLPADLKPGTHLIEVRTKDMHGRTYGGRRVIRVQ